MKLGGWNARKLFRVCSKEIPGILAFQPPSFSAFLFVGVHGFKGSEVQGSIFVPGLHLERVFMRKASSSTCLI
jgi:hypothetical protein